MSNQEQKQQKSELMYNSFGIIHIHTFCSEKTDDSNSNGYSTLFTEPIDTDTLTLKPLFYTRHELEGFNVTTPVDNGAKLEGRVHVMAIKFSDNCIQISNRFVVFNDQNGQYDSPSDLLQQLERWNIDKGTEQQTINSKIKSITFTEPRIHKAKNGAKITFEDVFNLHKADFVSDNKSSNSSPNLYHTYIDVCHGIQSKGEINFSNLSEPDIITHIATNHKPESIGLMTLYPKEWIYRGNRSFEDICGRNIGIDTDDLGLTNQNFTLIIGTYGRQDNWKEHLKRRDTDHVCWPEYLVSIEMLLTKKQMTNYTVARYIEKSNLIKEKQTQHIIDDNAKFSIELSNTILKLNPLFTLYVA